METIDTVVVGGGQAGLAVSYYLQKQGREHVVLEQAAQAGEAWRNHRWDSFTLVTPNWSIRLPGAEYAGNDPDGFTPRADVVRYFEQYVTQQTVPIRYGVRVTRVAKADEGFLVETDAGPMRAANVVIATGMFQKSKMPEYSRQLGTRIQQLRSEEYRNPNALAPGAVLVVGSAQSGCQIAEELYQAGRTVYLGTGTAPRMPRRYRGKDIFSWLTEIGFFDEKVADLPSPRARFAGNPQVSGKNGGHTLNLHQFARDGVVLLGHVRGGEQGRLLFAGDLYENLAQMDKVEQGACMRIDAMIEQRGLNAPKEELPRLRDGYEQKNLTELDLSANGITTVIWAMGYGFDFRWVEPATLDEFGYPVQTRGVTDVPGLYFLGLNWLYTRKSATLFGIAEDAAYLADRIGTAGAGGGGE